MASYYAFGSFPPTLRSTRKESVSPGTTVPSVITLSRYSYAFKVVSVMN